MLNREIPEAPNPSYEHWFGQCYAQNKKTSEDLLWMSHFHLQIGRDTAQWLKHLDVCSHLFPRFKLTGTTGFQALLNVFVRNRNTVIWLTGPEMYCFLIVLYIEEEFTVPSPTSQKHIAQTKKSPNYSLTNVNSLNWSIIVSCCIILWWSGDFFYI